MAAVVRKSAGKPAVVKGPVLRVVKPVRVTHRDRIIPLMRVAKRKGVTAAEVEFALGLGHGKMSGALSGLHLRGVIEGLWVKRDGQFLYVLPKQVGGRSLRAVRHNKATKERALAIVEVETFRVIDDLADARGKVDATLLKTRIKQIVA